MPRQKYTEARAAANKRWKDAQDQLSIRAPKGTKDVILAHLEGRNESMSAFIQRAIRETIDRDNERRSTMRTISLDNGATSYSADELHNIENDIRNNWNAIVNLMDDDTREAVHADLAPCDELEFLAEYLRRASDDLVIG